MSVQDIRIMSGNCRGLNNEVAKRMVRDSSSQVKANFIYIQETKCTSWPASGMKLFGNSVNDSWIVQNSEGASGLRWVDDLLGCRSIPMQGKCTI